MTAFDTYTNQGVLRGLEKFVWNSDVTRRHLHWTGTIEFISYYYLRVTRAVICAICFRQIPYYPNFFKCCPVFRVI